MEKPDNTEPATVIEKCGTCRFAHRLDMQFIECHGAPPTPQAIAGGQDALGRQAFNIQLFRPRLSAQEPACALYKFGAPRTVSPAVDLRAVGRA